MHDQEGGAAPPASEENCDNREEVARVVGHHDVGRRHLPPKGSPSTDR